MKEQKWVDSTVMQTAVRKVESSGAPMVGYWAVRLECLRAALMASRTVACSEKTSAAHWAGCSAKRLVEWKADCLVAYSEQKKAEPTEQQTVEMMDEH